ncbi:MAG: hypothetical protein HOO85_00645 [Methylotenera sp.]|nr:hypothetical protein [Methylotenera sp.]
MNTFFRLSMTCALVLTLAACVSNKGGYNATRSENATLHTHSQDFTGWYTSSDTSNEALVLHCLSNTVCELQMVSVADGKASSDVMKYHEASTLEDIGQVEYAYEYARDHRNHPSASSEEKELLKALEPLFQQTNVAFNHCIDLDPNLPKYMVACKLTSSPRAEPTVIFFGTQLTDNCGIFCRFTLLPLHEFKKKPENHSVN